MKKLSEITKMINEANETGRKYYGLRYEDGVKAALFWVVEAGDEPIIH